MVKRSDWVRPRVANARGFQKSAVPREPTNVVMKTLEQENDFWTLADRASSKLLDRSAHNKFMSALKNEQSKITRVVNLEILEEFAAKEVELC